MIRFNIFSLIFLNHSFLISLNCDCLLFGLTFCPNRVQQLGDKLLDECMETGTIDFETRVTIPLRILENLNQNNYFKEVVVMSAITSTSHCMDLTRLVEALADL